MLARALPPESRSAAEVAQIDHAARRAADLTRQLLAFSRRQLLEPAPVDLAAAVQQMAGMIRRLIGEDIELRIVAGTDAGVVLVDAGQVEQVVMNLVVNARDAMQNGGVLTLETARAEPNPERPGTYTMLSISDTGAGMDEQTKAHLFEPFFTTKERGEGTGLGLSIVMGIVEQSGGYVAVDSALGRGTTFRVFLPVTDRKPAPAPVIIPRTLTPVSGRWRVLVVEDEAEVRELIRDVLRQAGYDVLDASDGEHALRIAREIDIHLLLTDVIMPRMGGRELAARFAEIRPDARVLYMSGYADDKLGQHGVLDPGIALIQKPLTPEVLLRRLRELLA
jgi:CheY-like chemotaxis protein